MSKQYVAAIMQRHYLAENTFIYSTDHIVLGTMDEKNKIFIDRNDNEYISILDESLAISEIPYGYSDLISINKLQEILGQDMPLYKAITEYEKICNKRFIYVSKFPTGKIYSVVFNKDELENKISQAFNPPEKNESKKVENKQDAINLEALEEESRYMEEDFEMDPELASLILDVNDDVYTKDELKEILENLQEEANDIEQVIGLIDAKISAAENDNKIVLSKSKNYIDINEVFKNVTKTLIAQDEPARRVITEIARKEMYPSKKKDAILLTGATGVGKTELMRLIAKYINKPFIKVDTTQLTVPGYVGKDIEEVLWDLYEQCGRDKERTEQAIIFFDEVDKKGSSKKDDISGQGVLNVLLSFITGSEYDATSNTKLSREKVKINTSNMTVILGGAFTDVYNYLNNKKSLGFSTTQEEQKLSPKTNDFVEKAMMTNEFMGRTTIVKMNDLDVQALKRIMLESDESALLVEKKIFADLGVKLTFTDDYLNAAAIDAINKKTGARGLNSTIDNSTWQAFAEVYSNPSVYSEAILEEKSIYDSNCYQLIKKRTNSGEK